ncbi:MAG: efflux RND transporter periplasmic adaptor subunit [Candidatus Dormibacteria bacterium]
MSRLLRARLVGAAVAVIAVAAVGAFLYSSRATTAPQYRTAAATMGTVTQTLPISGNLVAATQTDLDFLIAGRVQGVNVSAGQAVKAGAVLANLDDSVLHGALSTAQANLASAQAKLAQDRTPTPQALASAQASVNSASIALLNAQTSLMDTQAANAQAVTAAQDAQTSANNKLQRDSNQRDSDCNSAPAGQACQQDKNQVSADNDAVRQANDNYNGAVVKQQQSDNQAAGQVNSARVQLQNAQSALAVLQQGATPQQVQMDLGAIQVAQVNVDTAQRNLSQATLTAPTDGVVGQVNITVGQSVSGGASAGGSSATSSSATTTHAVSLQTPGAFVVTGAISDAQVNQVVVGQAARVTPAGATQALMARVSAVAPTATIASSVATFPVTVTLTEQNNSLHAGTSASVSIIVHQVSQVLTVPTSAVRSAGAAAMVQVLVNGHPQARPVQLGATDALRTQVVSGLSAGDEVVIATVSRTVPTNPNGGGLFSGPGGGRGGRGGPPGG